MDDQHAAPSMGHERSAHSQDDHLTSDISNVSASSPKSAGEGHVRQDSSSSLHFSDAHEVSQSLSERDYSLDEGEMQRQLNEVESSFMPDSMPAETTGARPGADDTYVNFGSPTDTPPLRAFLGARGQSGEDQTSHLDYDALYERHQKEDKEHESEEQTHGGRLSTDSIDSPSAAAAMRNNARARVPSALRNEISARAVQDSVPARSSSKSFENKRAPSLQRSESSGSNSLKSVRKRAEEDRTAAQGGDLTAKIPLIRPAQKHGRQVSLASTASAFSDFSNGSDSTINADYALQTGGAAPGDSPLSSRHARDLSRLPSFGSIASDVVRDPDNGMPAFNRGLSAISGAGGLSRTKIDEEVPATPHSATQTGQLGPTDTVIAQHVSNIRVPDTVAQDFASRFTDRAISPEKRNLSNAASTATATGRPQSTLTLKEQNSKIDKLTKENFDLKLKIHFLDQALQSRSDEGVKDMINKSVTLQTDLTNERRDNASLRRRVRELEKQLSDLHEELADLREGQAEARTAGMEEMEIQIEELREQLDHAQVRITKLSAENLTKEMERRKMGEYLSAMQDRDGNHSEEVEEELSMWRDLLTEEQGRREMAEDESRRLREEVAALRRESDRRKRDEVRASRAGSLASGATAEDRNGSSVTTLVEQLRQENVELRRDLGAQTSMLTSRNRERERLQQEIEDLKLSHRKGGADGRSLAGDSILERSASRAARAPSRVSGITGESRLSDAEREEYERREGLLRDENAQLRLACQDLEKDSEDKMDYIAQLEEDLKGAELDLAAAVEDLRALQKERDEALLTLEEKEGEYERIAEDYKRLEDEAVSNIEGLEDNVAQLASNRDQVADELRTRSEDFSALQRELRALGSQLIQIESDRETSVKRIETLERELDDSTTELESLERKLGESDQKNQRLEVQAESLQNEVTFLREEQEGDKVKIGDLTNALHAAQQAVHDEREKMQELESSLVEERRQREMIDDKSKQEVQRVINDLNTDNARARDDLRKLRRNMTAVEADAETYKSRLQDLEINLRRILGEDSGSRSSLIQDVEKLQHDLERVLVDLDAARADIADKDRLIRSRDVLLESSGLEARRLGDLLEKERQARRHDAHNFEMAQRGSSTHLRAIANHETRNMELEAAVSQAKRRSAQLEAQYKNLLEERNALLLSIWNRLSTLCGAEWAQSHSAIGSEPTTTTEGIGKFLPQFQKNILSAVRQIESLFSGFKGRIRAAERTMSRDMATISHTLESKTARLDKLERSASELVEVNAQLRSAIANSHLSTSSSANSRSPSALSNALSSQQNKLTKLHHEEMNRLKSEIKGLKSELKIHRQHPSREASERIAADAAGNGQARRPTMLGLVSGRGSSSREGESKLSPANLANRILRHHSEGAVRTLDLGGGSGARNQAQHSHSTSDFSTAVAAAAAAVPRHSAGSSSDALLHRQISDASQPQQQQQQQASSAAAGSSDPSAPTNDQRWLHRLRELERRLKAEREARLLDRRGARQRLEERSAENDELRAELERERVRAGSRAGAEPDVVAARHGSVSSLASSQLRSLEGNGDADGPVSEEEEEGADYGLRSPAPSDLRTPRAVPPGDRRLFLPGGGQAGLD